MGTCSVDAWAESFKTQNGYPSTLVPNLHADVEPIGTPNGIIGLADYEKIRHETIDLAPTATPIVPTVANPTTTPVVSPTITIVPSVTPTAAPTPTSNVSPGISATPQVTPTPTISVTPPRATPTPTGTQ